MHAFALVYFFLIMLKSLLVIILALLLLLLLLLYFYADINFTSTRSDRSVGFMGSVILLTIATEVFTIPRKNFGLSFAIMRQ
jgi:hypothetical protein